MNKKKYYTVVRLSTLICLIIQHTFLHSHIQPIGHRETTQADGSTIQQKARSLLNPWEIGNPHELVEFEFENAELISFVRYIEEQFQLNFILDDDIKPTGDPKSVPVGGKNILGTKISFKTHAPLSKKDAWAIFLKFLDLSGVTVVPGPAERVYRITSTDPKSPLAPAKEPIPTFMGTHPDLLPDNDTYIRYVYFVRDANLDTIKTVFDTMKSANAPALIPITEVRGIIITDKAYNVRMMINVAMELDSVSMPETMSVIKLKRADARKVADLYKNLVKEEGQETLASRMLGGRKSQTLNYFAPGTRVIPEPRTNTLIILGTEDSVKKIEDFILKEIDKEIEKPYSPLHVYTLKHVKAKPVADILTKAVKFQEQSDAAKAGGVRDGDKFFAPISIIPEESGNRLVITADYDAYLKLYDILQKIDVEQPQVAMKVMIIDIDLTDTEDFGSQIRNKKPGVDGLLSNDVNFQTSGLGGNPVVENPTGTGANRLLGNLVSLASGGAVGSTYIALGSDCFGVWGMFRMLETYTRANILANPFLVTTNNYPAQISLGTTRRILTGNTIAANNANTQSFGNIDALISVSITPQISYEGFITLDIVVTDNSFTSTDQSNGNRIEKEIRTNVILANNEVLALGGIIKDTISETESKVPVLGDIPYVGWFFKNKTKSIVRTSLLVLIAPEIIPTDDDVIANKVTAAAINDTRFTLSAMHTRAKSVDPVHRWFFNDNTDESDTMIKAFTDKERRYLIPRQEAAQLNKKRLSDYL